MRTGSGAAISHCGSGPVNGLPAMAPWGESMAGTRPAASSALNPAILANPIMVFSLNSRSFTRFEIPRLLRLDEGAIRAIQAAPLVWRNTPGPALESAREGSRLGKVERSGDL